MYHPNTIDVAFQLKNLLQSGITGIARSVHVFLLLQDKNRPYKKKGGRTSAISVNTKAGIDFKKQTTLHVEVDEQTATFSGLTLSCSNALVTERVVLLVRVVWENTGLSCLLFKVVAVLTVDVVISWLLISSTLVCISSFEITDFSLLTLCSFGLSTFLGELFSGLLEDLIVRLERAGDLGCLATGDLDGLAGELVLILDGERDLERLLPGLAERDLDLLLEGVLDFSTSSCV